MGDDGGEYWAAVAVFDAQTGERLPSREYAIAGIGQTYHLEPGERVPVHAAFTSDMSEHPPGRYELEATLKELHLRSERKLVQLD